MLIDLFKVYKEIGLLEHSNVSNYMLEQKVKAFESEAAVDILKMAGNIIIETRDRDARHPDDYRKFLEEMRDLSQGIFEFSNLEMDWINQDKGDFLVGFNLGQRRYETELHIHSCEPPAHRRWF